MKDLLVITNGRAGGTGDGATRSALDVLRSGARVEVAETRDPAELAAVLGGLGDRLPVILGGDGSVHALIAAAHRLGRLGGSGAEAGARERPFEFGIVPMGTGNDLARTLRLPLDPAEAAKAVLDGQPSDLDVLVDDTGGVVVNAVHLGVGAEAGRRAVPLKPRLGKLAYPVGSAVAGASARGWRLRVAVDGRVVAGGGRRVLMAALGNGVTVGGGARVAPSAHPDDGQADVVVSFSTGWRARLGFAVALVRGRHPERHDVVEARGHAVTVTADEPVPVNADGELSMLEADRSWTVLHHAARVIAPPP
ncbi:diacylglycerol/lipid kinase family protein [Jiangella gansuensis]|uniref:diacylglycerol/lipid kinase family protein n=1 Tax=Jiangella gansuensis TaxID=281473 RepID=UPI00047B2538|nr:diacylglycerol kinase family protein [Jiangella gansuensis]